MIIRKTVKIIIYTNSSQTISTNPNDVSYQISSSTIWPYYQQQQPVNNLYYDSNTNYANSYSVYENSIWSKTVNNAQTNSSVYSANINYYDQNKSANKPLNNTKDQQQQPQTINIKEEPIQCKYKFFYFYGSLIILN